ncbi:uncharacterized protein LOC126740461 [Anthonomus grandis grandis]|uniref:uncharacterized protein LOC126740461 n=1 Tax=Anthonomus grandis grandis TaxID=2921223 RepID=UPI002165A84F|nr:uncharacterized protein LOC126740461 [Anthonomus grandis grandis]
MNNSRAANKPTVCPCPAPKRLITSKNWTSRNDSSKVNAILHPENFSHSSGKTQSQKIKGKVNVKPLLSCNTCYCRCKSQIPRPTFFKRPNTCISYNLSAKSKVHEDVGLKRKSLRCICDGEEDVGSQRSEVEQVSKSSGVDDFGLGKTAQRRKYEQYRKEQEVIHKEKLHDEGLEERYRRQLLSGGDGGTVDTLLGTQCNDTETSLSNDGLWKKFSNQTKFSKDIPTDEFPRFTESEWSIPEFRREHYFETHDIGKIGNITGVNSIDDHTCVHQFKLDKRWLPVPINQDPFGRSLCKICDKPMEGSCTNMKSSGSMFSGSNITKAELRSYANAYKSGFVPKIVNLGRGKSKIEVLLDDSDVSQLSCYINRVKKPPVYTNSLALRHQRMRLI